jgi:hypothetical protein
MRDKLVERASCAASVVDTVALRGYIGLAEKPHVDRPAA